MGQSISDESGGVGRAEATAEQARALGNPLRLRILRLCHGTSLTNKELAQRLGRDPATTLHHVRQLVATGFLAPEAERRGARGAREIPYRATGRSWLLDFTPVDRDNRIGRAAIDAFVAEVTAAGPGALASSARSVVVLDEAAAQEFAERFVALVEEFRSRTPAEGALAHGVFFALHRQAE